MNCVDEVADLMRHHHLKAMAERLILQEAQRDKRPFLERLAEIVHAEHDARAGRAYARRASDARLPIAPELASVCLSVKRNLSRANLEPFRTSEWVRKKQSLVVVGKSGRGTTYLACALAEVVLRDGLRVRYEELPTLLADWHLARAGKAEAAFTDELMRADLLVLDEWGNTDETLDLEDLRGLRRCVRPLLEHRSVLIASKNPPEALTEWLGGRETADDLLDKLRAAHCLELGGPSFRTKPTASRSVRGASRSSR